MADLGKNAGTGTLAETLEAVMSAPLKFLVVDPLAGVQIFIRQLLQSHGAAAEHIICCANTEAALAQGLVFKPDFLVTDWFPKSDVTGPGLYQRLREAKPAMQLALLSFEVSAEHEFEAEAHGARFLLKKPFTPDQLKGAMAGVLAALAKPEPVAVSRFSRPALRPMPPPPVVKPGDKVRFQGGVHIAQHVVHRHGETVVQLKGQASLIPLDKLQPA